MLLSEGNVVGRQNISVPCSVTVCPDEDWISQRCYREDSYVGGNLNGKTSEFFPTWRYKDSRFLVTAGTYWFGVISEIVFFCVFLTQGLPWLEAKECLLNYCFEFENGGQYFII